MIIPEYNLEKLVLCFSKTLDYRNVKTSIIKQVAFLLPNKLWLSYQMLLKLSDLSHPINWCFYLQILLTLMVLAKLAG